jgi:hypothetical protein
MSPWLRAELRELEIELEAKERKLADRIETILLKLAGAL